MQYRGRPFKLQGTGFVPCQYCDRTKTAEELVDEINSRRACPEAFSPDPEDNVRSIYSGPLLMKAVAEFYTDEAKG